MVKTPQCIKVNAANRKTCQQSYSHLFWQNQPKQTRIRSGKPKRGLHFGCPTDKTIVTALDDRPFDQGWVRHK
jgi:hypothetical protein